MTERLPAGFTHVREIGRGGFAVVHLAEQDAVGREVAIKLINDRTLSDEVTRRFRRECVAVGQLSWHPHIAQVFDAGATEDGDNYIIFEYLPNGSLGDRLESGRLDERTATAYAVQIADALAAAHSEQVLHRDLKPDNVLLDRLGRAKLADFGIADMRDGTRTATGTVTATIYYAAPEILSGARADERTEVYGLAATLHALLAGLSPFEENEDTDIIAIIGRIATRPPPDLRQLGVTTDVASVVETGLAKLPEDRYASAAEFGQALQQAQRTAGREPTPMPFVDQLVSDLGTESEPSTEPDPGPAPAPGPVESPGKSKVVTLTGVEPAQPDFVTQATTSFATTNFGMPTKSRTGVLAAVGALCAAALVGVGLFFALGGGSDPDGEAVESSQALAAEPTALTEPTSAPAPTAVPEPTAPPEPTVVSGPVPAAAPEPTALPARLATGEGIQIDGNWELSTPDCAEFDLFAETTPAPTCYRIDVPERWDAPDDARIQLAFAVLPPLSGEATEPPLVYFSGGPGERALYLTSLGARDLLFEPMRTNREVIVFDQRGAGLSEPVLACPEFDTTTSTDVTSLVRATDDCFRRLTDSGIDLRAYSAAAMAHDVRAILDSLGHTTVQILGQSYGTRAALSYIRLYGDDVDAMVLDSVRSLDSQISTSRRPDFERSTQLVIDTCAQSSSCNGRYPNLGPRLQSVADRLRESPIDVQVTDLETGETYTAPIDDVDLAVYLHGMLTWPEHIVGIPAMINELDNGGSTVLAQVIAQRAASLASVDVGQLIVVNCNDELAFEDPLAVFEQRDESVFGLLADNAASGFSFEDCDALPDFASDPIENELVRSSVPALLLVGRFDPILPPEAMDQAAAGLPNATSVVFDWEGHTTSGNECGRQLMAAFLADPRGRVDLACVDQQPPLTYS